MATTKNSTEKLKNMMKGVFVFPLSPERQFRRLVIVTLMLLAALVAFHMYFFKHIESPNLFQSNTTIITAGQTVNEKKLTSVLARFQDKAAVRAIASQLSPLVAEPSK